MFKVLVIFVLMGSVFAGEPISPAKQPTTFYIGFPNIVLHWSQPEITYQFIGVPEALRQPMRNQMAKVMNVVPLRFTEAPVGQTGSIRIVWEPFYLTGPNWVAAAGTDSFGSKLEITSASIYFNTVDFDFYSGDAENFYGGLFVDGGKRKYDIEGVFLHEFGHCLGLNHIQNDTFPIGAFEQSMMLPYLGDHSHIIWPYDVRCLQYLYPSVAPSEPVSDLVIMQTILSGYPAKYRMRVSKYKGSSVNILTVKSASFMYNAKGEFIK